MLSGKALGAFCSRSKGTNMFDVLEVTYDRRVSMYRARKKFLSLFWTILFSRFDIPLTLISCFQYRLLFHF